MFGHAAFATTPFAGTVGAVHALTVLENGATVADATVRLTAQPRALENLGVVADGAGGAGSGSGVREGTASVVLLLCVHMPAGRVLEQSAGAQSNAQSFSAMPVNVAEGTVAAAPDPFVRSRWEFIMTSTGGQWVPVNTKG
jgi:hypothetical protein